MPVTDTERRPAAPHLRAGSRDRALYRRRAARILIQVLLVAAALVALYPLIFMVSGSFKRVSELTSLPPTLIPRAFDSGGYEQLATTGFPRWFANSIVVTGLRVCLTILVSSMAAFAFAVYRFPFRRTLFIVVVGSLLLPFEVLYLPLLSLMIDLDWMNTYQALILPFVASGFSVFVIHQYMVGLPSELIQAARVDGASEWRIYWSVAMPLSRPILGAISVILFIQTWNSFFWPLIVLQDTDLFVLPVGLTALLARVFHEQDMWTAVLAGSTLMTIPMVIVFLVMQRQLVAGLTEGFKA
ncbi:MAG: carbohydrate ABC transporter permease [bacterium]|nr:carbohydrate ABC transporter permease [bacterium]